MNHGLRALFEEKTAMLRPVDNMVSFPACDLQGVEESTLLLGPKLMTTDRLPELEEKQNASIN